MPLREAVIDPAAISRNVEALRSATGGSPAMVVVKANGYGHGAVSSALAALEGGATWLGVADLAEALELREAGVGAPILAWLHGGEDDLDPAIASGVDIGVSSIQQLERAAAASGIAAVQLKFDTGLSRNGAPEAQWARLVALAAGHERAGRIVVRGLFSHLANAGPAEDLVQVERFEAALDAAKDGGLAPEVIHLAATAGALRVPQSRFGMVRVGIGAYGLSPFEDASSADLGLTPAMEFATEVVGVKTVDAGVGVSYGYDYRVDHRTNLALVPVGYADGVPRQASNRGPVWINGKHYRVAGRVAMDQLVVDVSEDRVSPGDRAVLFGDPANGYPSATDWADAAGTINYEIVTRVGSRVVRRYLA